MGSLFPGISTQKQKIEKQTMSLNNQNSQKQPSISNLNLGQTQSIGEQIQDREFSFNEEYFNGKLSQKTKGQINVNFIESNQAILIDQSGKLIRQVNECKQNNYCYDCRQLIQDTVIKIICQHQYHEICFIQQIEKQLSNQERFIIKCKCGTKLNSNILRQIVDVEVRSKFLYQIFSNQIFKLLQNSNIRKLCDLQQIYKMIELNIKKQDYDFNYDEKKGELQKNIIEYTINESGILHISQSKLFIISVCLYCGIEISNSLLKLNCGHIYHQDCLMNWLKFQIEDKKVPNIKCRCGTKINSNIIRRIPECKIRMKFLNYLFSVQLSRILPNLKKLDDYDQIWNLFYENQFTEDQDYNSSSGFLYFSNYSTPGGD
ncbi:unnamed protein product [Paramecium sonneborni]|uniref:WDR59/RTC1-like RING zinc finger domain-containing protein n=1 Tax=Paramecium sonneborni TaxID=65129 RepID=A0A8S1PHD3_9CILI|nr:unnamed protein product [Paramecium sonneborni]